MSPPLQPGVQFNILLPGSIMTSVTSSQQFICVTTLSEPPYWYYSGTMLSSKSTSNANSCINLYKTGNYTCSINSSNNYTVTLTAGLLYKSIVHYSSHMTINTAILSGFTCTGFSMQITIILGC